MSTPHTGGADPPLDPRVAFAELSKIMLSEQQLSDVLGRVAALAKQTITGAADVSVTLMDDGHVSSVAFTGALSAQLDERQYEAGFGPCMDAALSGATVTIENTAADPTYPDFGRAAARRGITHTMSIGLPVARQTIGALNIYGTAAGAAGAFDAETPRRRSSPPPSPATRRSPSRTPASTPAPPPWRATCSVPCSPGASSTRRRAS